MKTETGRIVCIAAVMALAFTVPAAAQSPAATETAEPALDPTGSTTGMPRSSMRLGAYGFFTWPPSEL